MKARLCLFLVAIPLFVAPICSAQVYNTIVIDSEDRPHFASRFGNILKYGTNDGSGWRMEDAVTVPIGRRPLYPSIQVTSNDTPCISFGNYLNANDNQLEYTFFDGTNWPVTRVDSGTSVSEYGTSLVLDTRDRPRIAYHYHRYAYDGKYAYNDGSGWMTQTFDSSAGYYADLCIDSNDVPHVAYFHNNLYYGHKKTGSWSTSVIHSGGYSMWGALRIRMHPVTGYPVIAIHAHTDSTPGQAGALRYASYDGTNWTVQTLRSLVTGYGARKGLGFGIDAEGIPHFTYYDYATESLIYGMLGTNGFEETTLSTDSAGYGDMALDSNGIAVALHYQNFHAGLEVITKDGTNITKELLSSYVKVTARTTLDRDGNGHIDAIRVTCDRDLNDDFTNITVVVDGYTVLGYDSATPGDMEFLVLLEEGPAPDTDARPDMQLMMNQSLFGGTTYAIPADTVPWTADDGAPPVLVSMQKQAGGFALEVSEEVNHLYYSSGIHPPNWEEWQPPPDDRRFDVTTPSDAIRIFAIGAEAIEE